MAKKNKVDPSILKQPNLEVANSISSKGFHKLFFREWESDINDDDTALLPSVICLHGLTRNSRDFDTFARDLSKKRRVICPDTVGRGHSDWLRDKADYNLSQYNLDVAVIAAKAGIVRDYDLVGTSLGGLMGIILASMDRSPIRRLVVNDIAPEIPMGALQRLSHYLGEDPTFSTIEEVDDYIRVQYAPFGPMSDDDWREMANYSSFKTELGYKLAYDATISKNYERYWMLTYFNIWDYWKQITCPVLVIRGTDSDFLTEELMEKMKDTLPHAEFIEFEGVGHTPTLKSKEQIDPIKEWLNKT